MIRAGLPSTALLILAACLLPSRVWSQDNLITGENINGYTGVLFDTRAYPYDYLVDGSIARDEPAQKTFKTLQAAYEAAPAGTPERPTIIGIKPDVYFLRGSETTAGLTIKKNYVTLLGLTDDRRKVVLADDRGHMEGATDNGYMVTVDAIGFTAMNLTFVNYCNLDYEYPGDPSKDLKRRTPYDAQAVAIQMRGDKQVFSHVAFLGRHDTIYVQTVRSYFTNAFVEGNEGFLDVAPGVVSVWKDSEVYIPSGSGVLSASGVIFINTVFKASHGMSFYKFLTTPDVLINCVLPVNTPQSPVSWMLARAPMGQRFYSLTYHTKDAEGNPAVIFDSNVGLRSFNLSRELTDREAAAFNPWNLLRATPTGAVDNWDPAGMKKEYASHGNDVFRMRFIEHGATAEEEAANPPRSYTELFDAPVIHAGGPPAELDAVAYPARVQDNPITWSTTSNAITLDKTSDSSALVTPRNDTGRTEYAAVTATASDGFHITTIVKIEPVYEPPAQVSEAPALHISSNGKAEVSYRLSPGGKDVSRVTWYLCDDGQCAKRREVAVSRGDLPLKDYPLGIGAIGKYVEAEVQPKFDRSEAGPVATAISSRPVVAGDVKTTTVSPNFRNFVTSPNDTYVNGMWTVLGAWQSVTDDNLVYWESTTGSDLVNGYGLRVASQGASLLYQNDEPTGDMQVKVVMTPEKIANEYFGYQGFGSPGSSKDEGVQRADIFIKYDPRTETGYSLRFWHTIESAETCMFQLFKIDHGKGSPVSPQQELTGVFKPNTTFILSIVGTTFTARAADSEDGDTLSLRGTVVPNSFGGAGTYWSGTVRVGNSNVVSLFEISYPGKTGSVLSQ